MPWLMLIGLAGAGAVAGGLYKGTEAATKETAKSLEVLLVIAGIILLLWFLMKRGHA